MVFGVVGDVHGDFDALERAMTRHVDAAFWLSVGDVAADDLRYPDPVAPFYWIQGNNEDFAFIATGQAGRVSSNLHFLPNGARAAIGGVVVAALGGTFAPTWYETPASRLPFPGMTGRETADCSPARPVRDDKRRHFVHDQVDALKAMRDVDVLLTHEAARPFIVQAGARRLDAGKTVINEVLATMRPRLHFSGHHHRFSDAVRDGVRSIGLDLVSRSYVLVDSRSFEVTRIDAEA
jgi:hypothetical protein